MDALDSAERCLHWFLCTEEIAFLRANINYRLLWVGRNCSTMWYCCLVSNAAKGKHAASALELTERNAVAPIVPLRQHSRLLHQVYQHATQGLSLYVFE